MVAILPLLRCLYPAVTLTTMRQFGRIVLAILAMTGRVTMLGIARWTGAGGSYRTVQRFFHTVIPWATLFWLFFRTHLYRADEVYLLVGDETVVTKAGKQTHGLDRFFASLYGKAVPGLAFFSLSLVSIQQRRAFPIQIEQVVRTPEERAAARAKAQRRASTEPSVKRPRGRPKGSTTTAKTEVVLSPELNRIQTMVQQVLQRSRGLIPLTYLVLDGHFGHNPALQMVRQCKLHLISKLRADAALYLPATGAYAGRGPRRIYGEKLDPRAMPARTLCQTQVENGVETQIFQVEAHHKAFSQALNIVVIVKTNQHTKAQAHVILMSSDLALAAETLLDYYRLRFQIEFTFRDAKQYWGLEDFMTTDATAVTNAANLALFMVNLVERVLQDMRSRSPACSVLDVKAHCRGAKYVEEMLKILPENPDPCFISRLVAKLVGIGRIHAESLDPLPV